MLFTFLTTIVRNVQVPYFMSEVCNLLASSYRRRQNLITRKKDICRAPSPLCRNPLVSTHFCKKSQRVLNDTYIVYQRDDYPAVEENEESGTNNGGKGSDQHEGNDGDGDGDDDAQAIVVAVAVS